MFEFKPITASDAIKKLYHKEEGFAYVGMEDQKVLGSCYFMIEKSTVRILNLDFPQDMPAFGEGLIRSALNFAANRGAYMAECCCSDVADILERMRFEKKGDCYVGDIPTLLGGTCGNCSIN